MAANNVSQYSCVYIYGSERKPTREKKPVIVVRKQVPIPVFLEVLSLCGLTKESGFPNRKPVAFSLTSNQKLGLFLTKKYLISEIMHDDKNASDNLGASLC